MSSRTISAEPTISWCGLTLRPFARRPRLQQLELDRQFVPIIHSSHMTRFENRFVPFRLTICGIDELGDHRGSGVTHGLSILDPASPTPEAFESLNAHTSMRLRFHDVIEEGIPGAAAGSGTRSRLSSILDGRLWTR